MATGTVQDWVNELTDYGLGDDLQSDTLIDIINKVIQDVNTRQSWSFLETTGNVTLTSGVALVTLPARFNKAKGLIIPSTGTVLVPERRETIVKKYAASLTSTGTPFLYYFIGQQMYVYVVPDVNYTATLDYLQDEVTVTTATVLTTLLMPVKHQDVYVLGALQRLFALEDDTEMFSLFGQKFEQKIVDMMSDLSAHQFDMPDRMIDVWSDGGYW